MNSAHDLLADPPGRAATTQGSIASWYTQGTSDGLGDRLLMFDNTAASSLELLRFHPALADTPGFERALRESVQRFLSFKHAAFAHARSIQRLDGDTGLALVSTHIEGKRLSDIFRRTERHSGMHPAFATWLIRQLTTALADFHAHADGVAHGALTADRIVLTPERRLVIVEHVLGGALNEAGLSPDRLWRDVGVVVQSAGDPPRLDSRGDIVQLGLVALSVLLGRRLSPDDYPHRLDALLDEFSETAGRKSPALAGPLRQWLEHALDGDGFATALEAADNLAVLAHPGEHLIFGSAAADQRALPAQHPASPDGGGVDLHLALLQPAAIAETQATDMALTSSVHSTESLAPHAGLWAGAPAARKFSIARNIAIGLAAAALLEGVLLAQMMTRTTPAAAAVAQVPITIDSPTPGDRVIVDGREVGVTPLKLSVGSTVHSIRVISRERPAGAATASVAAASASDARAASALAVAAQRQRSGGLRLTAPIEVQVLEGEKVLGSSADGPIVAPAGVHQLDFVNAAVGYRSRQTVTIKAGEIVPLKIQPPDGRVSINAQPWAQVSIDGNAVGETPLANIAVPVGEHEIAFRHPQLGERRETVVVKSGVQTRISTTFSK